MTDNSELVKNFAALFAGRTDAYGSWDGGCIKQPVTQGSFTKHLWGEEHGCARRNIIGGPKDVEAQFGGLFDHGRGIVCVAPHKLLDQRGFVDEHVVKVLHAHGQIGRRDADATRTDRGIVAALRHKVPHRY